MPCPSARSANHCSELSRFSRIRAETEALASLLEENCAVLRQAIAHMAVSLATALEETTLRASRPGDLAIRKRPALQDESQPASLDREA